jgi:FMN phosphatase YigB (HAD superfamily)
MISFRVVPACLVNKGISIFFDSVVWSCEIDFRKPYSKAFQIILNRLSLNPDEVLMVGDNELADVEGAMKLGIKTLRVYDGQIPLSSKADHLVSRFDLPVFLKEMIKA